MNYLRFFRYILLLVLLPLFSFLQTISAQKIGILMANQYAERWIKEAVYLKEKLNELGIKDILMETAEDNAEKQISQAESIIQKGANVLIVISVDCDMSSKIIELAHKTGVKVIAYDRLILNSDLDYYVSFNSIKVGELLAGTLIKNKPTGNYIFINGPTGDFNSKLIRQGVMSILDPAIKKGDINLILDKNLTEWSELEGYMEISGFLDSNNPNPDAIITGADVIGVGIANALDERNFPKDVKVVGQDCDLQACKAIINGRYEATILKSPRKLANEAATLAYNIANNKAIDSSVLSITNNGKKDVPSLLLEPILINKQNIDKVVIASGHLTHEQIYGVK